MPWEKFGVKVLKKFFSLCFLVIWFVLSFVAWHSDSCSEELMASSLCCGYGGWLGCL